MSVDTLNSSTMNIKLSYPYSEEYKYETRLERINFDDERELDILVGNGFIISDTKGIKKDLKDENSIFSPKFGQTLKDVNPFANRYRCDCGATIHKVNAGIRCKVCGTKVKYVDDNFDYTGWIVLNDEYQVIHPSFYKSIEFIIGPAVLNNILCADPKTKDKDGNDITVTPPDDEPYFAIGMMEFVEKFDEILLHYINKKKQKMQYYDDIMEHRRDVFTHSIPVFTSLLRPFEFDNKSFYFEDTNSLYMMINKLKTQINNDSLKLFRMSKPKLQCLYDLQMKFNTLYASIEAILSGKKGAIRTLIGGRYNFTSRDVIVGDPSLRIDEVSLPYAALCELLQQRIINILHKSYSMSYNDAYNFWYKACITKNKTIENIIWSLIKNDKSGRGLPVLINRNPTISYGSIFQMYCVKMTDGYTMGTPLQVLEPMAADFDGDVLNVLLIINDAFLERASDVFNPRNAAYISKNDGEFNNSVNHKRDTIINTQTMIRLSRGYYSQENLAKIRQIIQMNKGK